MYIDDFVGGDDSTGTTVELTDVDILAEVTFERTNEDGGCTRKADSAPLPRPRLQRFLPLLERTNEGASEVYLLPNSFIY
ncbi:hypothetical protein HPB48_022684 [Haemaphysalis longicornis]|uniref:Uncharacterized protein n=1 Tax=Haemaphysalis longicornis TaxID=44386 RepID=A0A9J6GAU5_HAELO|nr:hypothetical protein HPB48_022684 [Haemaphysalis longicornis]